MKRVLTLCVFFAVVTAANATDFVTCQTIEGKTIITNNPPPGAICKGTGDYTPSTPVMTENEKVSSITELPRWLPEKALLPKLSTEIEIEGYALRVPQDYTLRTPPSPAGGRVYLLTGLERADASRPHIGFVIVPIPLKESTEYTREKMLTVFLGGIEKGRRNWKQSEVEEGTINGMKFIRAYWEGEESRTGLKMHGFNYVAMDGDKIIGLSSQDVEAHYKKALQLAETAIFTFKKQGTGNYTQSAPVIEPPKWLPQKALLPKLSDEIKIEGYLLRVPQGYTMVQNPPLPGVTVYTWIGLRRSDDTQPHVMLVVMDNTAAKTLQQAFVNFLAGLENRRKNWKQGNAEEGTINGMKFIRAYCEGEESVPGIRYKMHGFTYMAIDGDKIIGFLSQDVEAHYKKALQLAETAIFTFKKQTVLR